VVKKDMRDKVQTSLWLDRDVKRLIEDEGLNLTKWVNDNVLISLSVENEAEILSKIEKHEMSIKTLKRRLDFVISRDKSKDVEDLVSNQALFELREFFSTRMENNKTRSENLGWITSPKNVGRCKILKKAPEQVLDELEAWFDGVKKSEHEEN